MTIMEAISRIDDIKPNAYTHGDKVAWLSAIDGIIKREIIDTHEGGESIEYNGYDEDTSDLTELIVPAPYDLIYIRWLEAQIDYAMGEYERYSNSTMAYNDILESFGKYYNRTHKPKHNGKRFIF